MIEFNEFNYDELRKKCLQNLLRWKPNYNAEKMENMPEDQFRSFYLKIKAKRTSLINKLEHIADENEDFDYDFENELYYFSDETLKKIIEVYSLPLDEESKEQRKNLHDFLLGIPVQETKQTNEDEDVNDREEFLTDEEFVEMFGSNPEDYSESYLSQHGVVLEADKKRNFKKIEQKEKQLKNEIINVFVEVCRREHRPVQYLRQKLEKLDLNDLIYKYNKLRYTYMEYPSVEDIKNKIKF